MRVILYSLKHINEKIKLSIDLTGKLVDFENHNSNILEIKLDSGTIYLNKFEYLNKMKIFQDPKHNKVAFIVCNKQVSHESAFKALVRHSISKLDKRIENIQSFKIRLQKELAA